MKQVLRRIVTCMLAVALLATVSAGASQTAAIGRKTAKIVSIPMTGAYVGRVVTASGTVHNTADAAALIKAAVDGTGETVVAAVNGMFFNSYYNTKAAVSFPGNVPLILTNLVQDGKTIACGGEQNCVGFTKDGKVMIDRVNVAPEVYLDGRGPVKLWSVNAKNTAPDAVYMITSEVTLPYTMASDATAALIENGVVTKMVYGGTVTLSKGQDLLVYNSAAAASHAGWNLLPAVGTGIETTTKLTAQNGTDWTNTTSIAGGGRMLLHNGVNVCADASYNKTLDADPKQAATGALQRSFIAVKADGTLLMGTVVASFNDIAAYLKSIGATDAVSLDGGASSMLYENGGFVTSAGRRLASAIVITKAPAAAPEAAASAPNA